MQCFNIKQLISIYSILYPTSNNIYIANAAQNEIRHIESYINIYIYVLEVDIFLAINVVISIKKTNINP